MEFKFTMEEFLDMGAPHPLSGANTPNAMHLANYCNQMLKEWFDAAPTVTGLKDSNGLFITTLPGVKDTHKAKLVCIEEIK